MIETQRHNLILDFLEQHGAVSLKFLVGEIGASKATLRRDLIKLAERGRLRQVRGGATLSKDEDQRMRHRHLSGSAFLASLECEVDAKRLIAARAADICDDGDAIIINGGSTTYFMGEYLRRRSLCILTNSIALAFDLIENSNNRVLVPAGEAHRKLSFILNPLEDAVTDAFRASRYFLSACAVSAQGVMEADPSIARAEQRLARQADEIILLLDSTKIGRNSRFAAFDLAQIDKVITDERIGAEQLSLFQDNDVEVLIAGGGDSQPNTVRSA